MNQASATRPIVKGSWWTNGEHDVQITNVWKNSVAYRYLDTFGAAEILHFRENFAPVKREKKGAKV